MTTISLIVPVLNEVDTIREHLSYHRDQFDFDEIVVVDGGSTDGTRGVVRAADRGIQLEVCNRPGRARQLTRGSRESRGEIILMLHADTRLPGGFHLDTIRRAERSWGWFDCRLDEDRWFNRLIGRAISLRSALFSSPTGDQAIWVRRSLLGEAGGIPDQPLMEDVELVRRLRRLEPGRRIRTPVTTSARRWKQRGIVRTILTMWGLRCAYSLGVSPARLHRVYYGRDSGSDGAS